MYLCEHFYKKNMKKLICTFLCLCILYPAMAIVSKTETSGNKPEQELLLLRKTLDIAKTPSQKQTILKQIGRTGTFLGLLTAGKYLDDSNNNVKKAAAQAVSAIALIHPEYYGSETTALLNKTMAINKKQKQAILKYLAALPTGEGFVSMFNEKDLTGWKGLVENPIARAKMNPQQLAEKQEKADEIMRQGWQAVNGILMFNGHGDNICSVKQYGDFEMYVDWMLDSSSKEADAGIYLRGTPQVQIWDIARVNVGAQVGSGGLYNNTVNEKNPLVLADNPLDEWNSFYIKMVGERVTVIFNGQLVVDNVILENYWDRKQPIFPVEQIELQAHGSKVYYRDIYIRELLK